MPAERDNGVAVAEKPGVAGVVGEIFIAAVDEREDTRKAAVGIFEEEGAIAFGGIFRANGDEVCGKFDFAIWRLAAFARSTMALLWALFTATEKKILPMRRS